MIDRSPPLLEKSTAYLPHSYIGCKKSQDGDRDDYALILSAVCGLPTGFLCECVISRHIGFSWYADAKRAAYSFLHLLQNCRRCEWWMMLQQEDFQQKNDVKRCRFFSRFVWRAQWVSQAIWWYILVRKLMCEKHHVVNSWGIWGFFNFVSTNKISREKILKIYCHACMNINTPNIYI